MVRDNLADAEYFSKRLLKEEGWLAEDLADVRSYIEERGANASGIATAIVITELECAEIQYSRGDAMEIVRQRVINAMDNLKYLHELYEKYPDRLRAKRGSYLSAFIRLEFAVGFCVDPVQAQRVVYDVEFFEYKDPILLAMLAYLKNEPIDLNYEPSDLDYPERNADLWLAIVYGGDAAIEPLKRYLEGWYEANDGVDGSGTLGIGSHKKMIGYRGYWCWEAAAVAVMRDIDDSSFRDHQHYPKDLADWARAHKRNS